MFTHRLALGLVTLSLSLSGLACGTLNAQSGRDDSRDSTWRVAPLNNQSSTPNPPTRIAQDSRRDRMKE